MSIVELGQKYKDTFTGFEGIATCRSVYLYGCVRIQLEGMSKEGEPQEFWFDEQRLVSLDLKPVQTDALTGGPRSAPRRQTARRSL